MSAPLPHAATEAQVADFQRYASTIVTIGRHPDKPDVPKIDVVHVEGRPRICLRMQAAMLFEAAQKLLDAHGPDSC